MQTALYPLAFIFCRMSSHSDGLGSRNGWNSPDHTNSLLPSIISEYGSNVTWCVTAALSAGTGASAGPAAGAAGETAAPAAVGRAASPAAVVSTAPDSSVRRERDGAPSAGARRRAGLPGDCIVTTPSEVVRGCSLVSTPVSKGQMSYS